MFPQLSTYTPERRRYVRDFLACIRDVAPRRAIQGDIGPVADLVRRAFGDEVAERLRFSVPEGRPYYWIAWT